jgi:hypothetical protein
VSDELLNCVINEPLLGLGLPSEEPFSGDGFIKFVIRLFLAKSYEERVVPRPIRKLNDPLETPCSGLGSELKLSVEDAVDFFA